MRACIEGVGLCGPGLAGWGAGRAALSGETAYRSVPVAIPPVDRLPPAERRRVGVPVRLALAVGQEALAAAERDPAATPTVFASSGGDCDNVHHLCEALAAPEREVSPTRFHNSVHNAAAGYWSIAMQARAASTSLACYDATFAAGLLEAAAQIAAGAGAVALIACDHPYPAPLAAARPVAAPLGVALVLSARPARRALATLEIDFVPRPAAAGRMADAGLEALRASVPAGRGLPLLAALARGAREALALEYGPDAHLGVTVTPWS